MGTLVVEDAVRIAHAPHAPLATDLSLTCSCPWLPVTSALTHCLVSHSDPLELLLEFDFSIYAQPPWYFAITSGDSYQSVAPGGGTVQYSVALLDFESNIVTTESQNNFTGVYHSLVSSCRCSACQGRLGKGNQWLDTIRFPGW